MVRGRATELGILPSMCCENDSAQRSAENLPDIDARCVAGSRVARGLVLDQLDPQDASKDLIMNVLKEKRAFLTTTDWCWKVEHSFWASLSGPLVEQKRHRLI